MHKATALLLGLLVPVAVFAGDGGPDATCDSCIDVEGTIYPTPAWQTVQGSTTGQPNSEEAYYFCAVAGGEYTFTTCDAPGLPGAGQQCGGNPATGGRGRGSLPPPASAGPL